MTAGIEGRKTDTGTMKISSAALTALELLRYPQASGGTDNVATILSDVSLGVEKSRLAARVKSRSGTLVDPCRSPVRIDSIYPPGDTTAVVEAIEAVHGATAGIEHRRVVGTASAVNLVARTRGAGTGRRVVLNGHLDTFPIGEARWRHPPLGADMEDGRIYGRGACDMKVGVAALVLAFVTLAGFRDVWDGELVHTLVGDEETGGRWRTQYLLANVEEAVGDAMLNADTGSPRVVRTGEKGNVWVELEATGVANHAAHVHLGRNAVDALVDALGAVRALAALAPWLPAAVERTIAEAQAVSEAASGEGEAETLRRITVNTGRIEGGIGVNTIPDGARALCDIRIPPGVTVDRVRAELADAIYPRPNVLWWILECTEPSCTDPEEAIVRAVHGNAAAVTGRDVVVNLRAGFSDARFYRHAGVPSVVDGVTPNGMGGADEYATVEDLKGTYIHSLTNDQTVRSLQRLGSMSGYAFG